jgi:hypothetical protein
MKLKEKIEIFHYYINIGLSGQYREFPSLDRNPVAYDEKQ